MRRERAAALALAAALCALAPAAPARLRYFPGDVLQGLLQAQIDRAWTRARVTKTEWTAGSNASPSVSKGVMTSSGDQARLDLSFPKPGLIVADGRNLWVQLPEVRQVYRYNQASLAASGNFFLDLASSIRHYSKDSVKRRFPPGPGYQEGRVSAFELTPDHAAAAGFQRMRVWVDTDRWVVLRVLLDYGGTRDDIRFKDIRVMTWKAVDADRALDLPKGIFQYRKPKGYELFAIDL